MYDLLEVDMCLRIQNLNFLCANLLKNKGARAISVRGVFNKKVPQPLSQLFEELPG